MKLMLVFAFALVAYTSFISADEEAEAVELPEQEDVSDEPEANDEEINEDEDNDMDVEEVAQKNDKPFWFIRRRYNYYGKK